MKKSFLLFIIVLLALPALADDRTLTAGEYWVDNNHLSRTTVSIGSDGLMQFALDGTQLSEGLHTLHYRAQDSEGFYSAVQSWLFYRGRLGQEQAQQVTSYSYWIDNRTDKIVTGSVDGTEVQFVLDASAQPEGLHALHYRLTDDQGRHSPAHTWLFYRYVNEAVGASTLEYWIDETGGHRTLTITDAETAFVVDASALAEGLHTLHYRLNSQTGTVGPERTWLFYRVADAYEGGARTLEYWIDDADVHQTLSAETADVAFVLDASALDEGLHTLYYRVTEEGGRTSPQQSWRFYRVSPRPVGTHISWYRIWWNDHEDQAVTLQVANESPELLYEVTLAVPEYARNDGYSRNNTARFHIVFADDQGNLSPMETAVVGYPDIYPPVTTLSASTQADSIILSWTSNEDMVRGWNVYYSENGEPYVLWKSNITEQIAIFRGRQNAAYKFIVTARDAHNNVEAIEEGKSVSVVIR